MLPVKITSGIIVIYGNSSAGLFDVFIDSCRPQEKFHDPVNTTMVRRVRSPVF